MSKKKQKGISIRMLIPMVAVVLLLGCAIGGTIAWLTAQTDPVVNTFTVGDINITLYESPYNQETNKLESTKTEADAVTKNTYKIVPGRDMPKDPVVELKQGSEPCWVFIKIEENNFIEGLGYTVFPRWTKLTTEDGVYYYDFSAAKYLDESGVIKEDYTYKILLSDVITVSGDITKEDLAAIKDEEVSLNFTAYAIQHDGFATAEAAWAQIKSSYPDQFSTTPAE